MEAVACPEPTNANALLGVLRFWLAGGRFYRDKTETSSIRRAEKHWVERIAQSIIWAGSYSHAYQQCVFRNPHLLRYDRCASEATFTAT